MNYQCEICGRPLGYQGLCWVCRAERERAAVMAWTDEEIREKFSHLIANVHKLDDWKTEEYDTALKLISIRGLWSEDLQRAALDAGAFSLAQLYYHAPADVRDGLIRRLMETQSSHEAGNLMECLAMQGDDEALAALLDLERHPKPWRQELYVDPSSYAQCGGWTFDRDGKRIMLGFDKCYRLRKADEMSESPKSPESPNSPHPPSRRSPVKIGRPRKEKCRQCGCTAVDMMVIDGRDERLAFLGIDGVFTASCCPNCVCFMEAGYSRYTLDGGSTLLDTETDVDDLENYIEEEEFEKMAANPYVLDDKPSPLFLGACYEDLNTIGGFANWIQDWQYATCPDCGRPMRYLAQIQWDTLMEYAEGTLYIEFCPDCQVAAMIHQQT